MRKPKPLSNNKKKFFSEGIIIVCFLLLLFISACSNGDTAEDAESYPSRSIDHIIPSDPGGGWDTSSRIIADYWENDLGQPLQFDYRPGSGSQIAFQKLVD